MLTPLAIATWISICIPWAEPNLAGALIHAGSGGEPNMVTDTNGNQEIGATQPDAIRLLRQKITEMGKSGASHEQYIGLTQIPASALRELAIEPEVALDKCSNLEIGYTLLLNAYQIADKTEKNPWKRIALTYNLFRTGEKIYETPFSGKVIEYLRMNRTPPPAAFGSGLYRSILAEWSAGLASRHAMRQVTNPSSVLTASRDLGDEMRTAY